MKSRTVKTFGMIPDSVPANAGKMVSVDAAKEASSAVKAASEETAAKEASNVAKEVSNAAKAVSEETAAREASSVVKAVFANRALAADLPAVSPAETGAVND